MTITVFSFFLPHNKSRTNFFLIFKNLQVHIRRPPCFQHYKLKLYKRGYNHVLSCIIVHIHMNMYLQSYRVVIFRNSCVLALLQRSIFQCLGHILEGGNTIQNLSRKDFICIMSRIISDGFCCVINQALLFISWRSNITVNEKFCSHFLVVGCLFSTSECFKHLWGQRG